jgi:excinuclease ABC subunit A
MIELFNFLSGKRVSILTPLLKSFNGDLKKTSIDLDDLGFLKVRLNGKMIDIEKMNSIKIMSNFLYDVDVVVDRLLVDIDVKTITRFIESLQTALKYGDGSSVIIFLDQDSGEEFRYLLDKEAISKGIGDYKKKNEFL